MPWTYLAYRWPDEVGFLAALDAQGWQITAEELI